MSYISVRNLEKRFVIREKRQEGALLRGKKTVRALQGVSFDVERGARENPPRSRSSPAS